MGGPSSFLHALEYCLSTNDNAFTLWPENPFYGQSIRLVQAESIIKQNYAFTKQPPEISPLAQTPTLIRNYTRIMYRRILFSIRVPLSLFLFAGSWFQRVDVVWCDSFHIRILAAYVLLVIPGRFSIHRGSVLGSIGTSLSTANMTLAYDQVTQRRSVSSSTGGFISVLGFTPPDFDYVSCQLSILQSKELHWVNFGSITIIITEVIEKTWTCIDEISTRSRDQRRHRNSTPWWGSLLSISKWAT